MRYEIARSMKQFRAEAGRFVDRAHFHSEATILTHYGEPRSVIVSYEWYRTHRPAPKPEDP